MDDVETGTIKAGTGFWSRGSFESNAPGTTNPWRLATPIAPFDQEVTFNSIKIQKFKELD